jgi:signal transduction histidine kinase
MMPQQLNRRFNEFLHSDARATRIKIGLKKGHNLLKLNIRNNGLVFNQARINYPGASAYWVCGSG